MDSAPSTRIASHFVAEFTAQWRRFWFEPAEPHTLALIRIFAGAMLLYTHAIWTLDLTAFLGPNSWIDRETLRLIQAVPGSGEDAPDVNYAWSFWNSIESPALIYALHCVSLVVFTMLMLGLKTRIVSILACVITLSYCNRLAPATFGLDQVNAMLATYLMLGSSGDAYSLDRLIASRGALPAPQPAIGTNIAVRLIQFHMCVIYFFGGVSKLRGETWWDGSAVWHAVSNYEYQSFDLTALGNFPWLIALLTHITVFWETFYPVLIWPRATRGIMLALAVGVHGGIALFLGMPTFGLAMIIANLAFIRSAAAKNGIDGLIGFAKRALTGSRAASA